MSRALRILATILVLLLVWTLRGTRAAALATLLGGAWLRRSWVTRPARLGSLGRHTEPRAGCGRPPGVWPSTRHPRTAGGSASCSGRSARSGP